MDRRTFLVSTAVWAGSASLGKPGRLRGERTTTLGDDHLQLVLNYGSRGLVELQFLVAESRLVSLRNIPWMVEVDGNSLLPEGAELVDKEGGTGLPQSATFQGETAELTWKLCYEVSGPGRITKSFAFIPKKSGSLTRVSLWNAQSSREPRIASTAFQDIAAFYRQGNLGLFASLDYPYSNITTAAGTTSISYPPHDLLQSGREYRSHSLTFGAIRLTGKQRYGFDEGETEAMGAYIQGHRKPRFEQPMYVSSSIVNRYTQVDGDIVFYSSWDQPLLSAQPDLVEKDLNLMTRLGMEYYQAFPGVFEWGPNDPKLAVDRLVRFAHERGLRIGDYSATSYLYSPHFNFYRNHPGNPEWFICDKDGKQKDQLCFGNPQFVDLYIETVVSNCRRFHFDLHCLDLLKFSPCYAGTHSHPPGRDSYYHQVRGLMRVLEAINAVSTQMMTWPNSGDFTEMLPKLAWYTPNLYLTDPVIATPWQGLNMTRLLDDARREQMVSLHHSRFLPYRFFTNFQYFLSQNSVVPDIRNFEYGALSTLAVTPNLGLGEIRPWLDRLPDSDLRKVTDFYKRWTSLVRDNYQLWTKTYRAGENPGMGAVEIYSHAAGDRGFIFLVNPNYWDRKVEIPLDQTLGFTSDGRCEIAEIYPSEHLCLTTMGPWPEFGARVPVNVPAQKVVVLEVTPAPDKIDFPRVYGLPGKVETSAGGYLFKTFAPQGQTARFAIMLPKDSAPIVTAAVLDYPQQVDPRLSSPTAITMLSSAAEGACFEVIFRRKSAPTELRMWRAKDGSLEDGLASNWHLTSNGGEAVSFPLFADAQIPLPLTDEAATGLGLGPVANFCGAYIDNAFSETQTTWIQLHQGDPSGWSNANPAVSEPVPGGKPLPHLAKNRAKAWWFETDFNLPFLYTLGFEPAFDEHTIIVFPLVRHREVKIAAAWIDGKELNVQRYVYPVNRKLACYYADLVGSPAHAGQNRLVVHLSSAV